MNNFVKITRQKKCLSKVRVVLSTKTLFIKKIYLFQSTFLITKIDEEREKLFYFYLFKYYIFLHQHFYHFYLFISLVHFTIKSN